VIENSLRKQLRIDGTGHIMSRRGSFSGLTTHLAKMGSGKMPQFEKPVISGI
jgi:hypothetical protein